MTELKNRLPPKIVVQIKASKQPEMIDLAIQSLVNRDESLYQRSGKLVTIVHDPLTGSPTISPVDLNSVTYRLACHCRWQRWKCPRGQKGKWIPSDPDREVAKIISTESSTWKGIRPLRGIAEAPFMRADGEVVQTPGYDSSSSVVLLPGLSYPAISDAPTKEQAARSLKVLTDLFVKFPFRDGADGYIPVAAILTLLARHAIDGTVPLHYFDATTPGSGKTLLASIVSTIATGRSAALMSWTDNIEELEKVLATFALQGERLIVFDNVNTPLQGSPLDKALTQTEAKFRILGRSEAPQLPWTALIIATGNNISVRGDTERRVVGARLEPTEERPEDREGLPDIIKIVRNARAELVSAALTILRAYVSVGRPKLVKTWGGFEAYTNLVAGSIVFAGGRDVLETRPTARNEGDPTRACLETILDYWPKLDPKEEGLTVRSLVSKAYKSTSAKSSRDRALEEIGETDGFDDLREALEFIAPDRSGNGVDATRLGRELGKLRGRWVKGNRLVGKAGHAGVTRWKIESETTIEKNKEADRLRESEESAADALRRQIEAESTPFDEGAPFDEEDDADRFDR